MHKTVGNIVFLVVLVLSTLFMQPSYGENQDAQIDVLRHRWVDSIVGSQGQGPADSFVVACIGKQAETAKWLWQTMNKKPQDDLWADLDTAHNSAGMTATTRSLSLLAAAYATRGTGLYHNDSLRNDITSGLRWFLRNRYSATSTEYGNWWDWQIGVPLNLNPLLACLYDSLSPQLREAGTAAIAHFTPTIWATGANGTWRADIVLKRSILDKDAKGLETARDWISTTMLRYFDPPNDPVQEGYAEGFYRDGSFFAHDRHPYNGGYGRAALGSAAQLLALLHGSPWAVAGPERNNIYHWFFDSFAPFLYRGTLFENTAGREISRTYTECSASGALKILLPLIEAAPPPYKARLQMYAKPLASPDTFAHLNVSEIREAEALRADRNIPASPPVVLFKHFPLIARTCVLRSGFGASVSMYSDTVYDYEYLNGENHKGWHTSDGWLQIADSDAAQFTDGYWPTVDWHRLPGTTVVQGLEKPFNARNGSDWAGGATLDGVSGIAGFELKPGVCSRWDSQAKKTFMEPDGQALTARKSWFLLGDEIVCIGSDIDTADANPVETIIENRRLGGAGTNIFLIDGRPCLATFGHQEAFSARWMHLAGNVPQSDISYVFPHLVQVQALRDTRTGSWKQINDSGSDEKITRHYLTLWIDHGVKPDRAAYAYTILPGRSPEEVAHYAKNPNTRILAQTTAVHAVQNKELGIVAANFWEDAHAKIQINGKDWLSCDRKACVMVRQQGKKVVLGVSDPTRANLHSITVTLAVPAQRVLEKSSRVHVHSLSPKTVITIDLSNLNSSERGQTFTVHLEE